MLDHFPIMLSLTVFATGICGNGNKCSFRHLLDDAESYGYAWRLTADPDDPDKLALRDYAICQKMGLVEAGMTLWYCRKSAPVS